MSAFTEAFARTIYREGGFSNDPKDSGGATKYGIIERVAREEGYTGQMKDLPLSMAQVIAKRRYWDQLRLDDVAIQSLSIAEELFDTSYNMGQGVAGRFLQRALNALNNEQKLYSDVTEDGIVGTSTIIALQSFLKARGSPGVLVLVRALNCLQGARYFEIAVARPKDEAFIFGWLLNRVAV